MKMSMFVDSSNLNDIAVLKKIITALDFSAPCRVIDTVKTTSESANDKTAPDPNTSIKYFGDDLLSFLLDVYSACDKDQGNLFSPNTIPVNMLCDAQSNSVHFTVDYIKKCVKKINSVSAMHGYEGDVIKLIDRRVKGIGRKGLVLTVDNSFVDALIDALQNKDFATRILQYYSDNSISNLIINDICKKTINTL